MEHCTGGVGDLKIVGYISLGSIGVDFDIDSAVAVIYVKGKPFELYRCARLSQRYQVLCTFAKACVLAQPELRGLAQAENINSMMKNLQMTYR